MLNSEINKAVIAAVGLLAAILEGNGWSIPDNVKEGAIDLITWIVGTFLVWFIANKPASTTRGQAKSPPIVALLTGMLLFSMLTSCSLGIQRPEINSTSDAIVTTAADIESVADQVLQLCGNTEPGGECRPGSLIDTAQKNAWRDRLREAHNSLLLANRALAIGEDAEADAKLDAVEEILRIVRQELADRSR